MPGYKEQGQRWVRAKSRYKLVHGVVRTVQITLAGLGDAAATLLLVNLQDADLGERLHDLAVNRAGGIDVLGGARAAVLGGTVDLAETADTDGLAAVNVAGNGGGADVEPVGVLRRHLLGGTGLDGVNPAWWTVTLAFRCLGYGQRWVNVGAWKKELVLTRDGKLSLTLQEGSVGIDELVRLFPRHHRISNYSVFGSLSTPSRLL